MMNSISIALTGLESATKRLSASASNIANFQTTGSLEEGAKQPYSALTTQQSAITAGNETAGVSTSIVPKTTPFVPAYDPDSPFANANGEIGVPNVDLAEEAINVNLAEIQYKANLATIRTASELSDELFRIFDKKV